MIINSSGRGTRCWISLSSCTDRGKYILHLQKGWQVFLPTRKIALSFNENCKILSFPVALPTSSSSSVSLSHQTHIRLRLNMMNHLLCGDFWRNIIGGETLEQWLGQASITKVSWKWWPLQIGYGLLYLHQKSITHMDLKPSNVVIDINDNALLIDISGIEDVTYEWTAPELRDKDDLNVPLQERVLGDIWAYGMLLPAIARSVDGSEDVYLLHEVVKDTTNWRDALQCAWSSQRRFQSSKGSHSEISYALKHLHIIHKDLNENFPIWFMLTEDTKHEKCSFKNCCVVRCTSLIEPWNVLFQKPLH